MDIVIKEQSKRRLIFELVGSTHTICNILKEELWNDKNVTVAAYNIDHPLIGTPRFIIETTSPQEPVKALKDAIARLQKKNKATLADFSKLKV